ncbi:MAG: Clp protease N-terminal domain-containing protein [Gaiellaceae bacterium]
MTHRKARRHVVRLVDVGAERVEGPISFTPRVREIIEDAFSGSIWLPLLVKTTVGPSCEPTPPVSRHAPRLRANPRSEVRTEELLLALIAHGEGVAAHALSDLGVDLDKVAVASQYARSPYPTFGPPFKQTEWPPAPPKRN